MARERMVTRTINMNAINVKLYNLESDDVVTEMVFETGEKLTIEDATKLLRRRYKDNDSFQFIKVLSIDHIEQLYGMTEIDFLKYAVPMEQGMTKVPEKK